VAIIKRANKCGAQPMGRIFLEGFENSGGDRFFLIINN
jgi:hypothetical protein